MTDKKNARIGIIDAIRGVAIILMFIYHFAFDLYDAGMLSAKLMYAQPVNILREFFAALFVVISGVASVLSRNNLKRGLLLFAAGLAISLVTYIYDPALTVRFGVLSLLGSSAIIFHFTKKGLFRLPAWSTLVAFSLLAALTWSIRFHNFDVEHLWMFGFTNYYFTSADYFPLFPYLFIFLAGTSLGRYVADGSMPTWFYSFKCRFFEAAGRRSFLIYVIHQPVLIALTMLIDKIIGG